MTKDELGARRRRQRQQVRDSALSVRVVFPHTEGELAQALGDVEELLLAANADSYLDVDDPGVGAGPEALAAVGRLAAYVASVEREEPLVQPLAPDGRFELVPLHVVAVGRDDLAHILAALRLVVQAGRDGRGDERLVEVLEGWAGGRPVEQLVAAADRLRQLLSYAGEADVDDDLDVLEGAAGSAGEGGPGALGHAGDSHRRVTLTTVQHEAYRRLSGRIIETWEGGDALAGFLYRGSEG
jgi:hypothetical protein